MPRPCALIDPTIPLSAERERFAKALAMGLAATPEEAAREADMRVKAGPNKGEPILPGNAWRIARERKVQARIAFLAADEQSVVKETRGFVRSRLLKAARLDILKQFAIVREEEVEGKIVGRLVGIDWKALQESDFSVAVSSFKFDAKTGHLTDFGRDDALNAVNQLRDMYGLKASFKHEVTGKDGAPLVPSIVMTGKPEELETESA